VAVVEAVDLQQIVLEYQVDQVEEDLFQRLQEEVEHQVKEIQEEQVLQHLLLLVEVAAVVQVLQDQMVLH
jgi:hypothetical protein